MLARAASTRSHEAALGILKEAQALDPTRADTRDLIASRQAALDTEREEARRAAERQQKIAAAIAKAEPDEGARRRPSRSSKRRRDSTPTHAGLRAVLAERRDALDRERDEARHRRMLQEQIAAALARAEATPSHETAVSLLRDAVALDASHAGARTALDKRTEALEREREEARKVRARQEQAAAALARARETTSHEAAIALLTEALARDPGDAEMTQALDARRQALEEKRASGTRAPGEDRGGAREGGGHTRASGRDWHPQRRSGSRAGERGEVRQAVDTRQAALNREQEEARRAREREERIASAIADAKKTHGARSGDRHPEGCAGAGSAKRPDPLAARRAPGRARPRARTGTPRSGAEGEDCERNQAGEGSEVARGRDRAPHRRARAGRVEPGRSQPARVPRGSAARPSAPRRSGRRSSRPRVSRLSRSSNDRTSPPPKRRCRRPRVYSPRGR